MVAAGAPTALSEVALVLPSFGSGGAERVVLNLARGLVAAGADVRLLMLEDRGPLRALVPSEIEIVDLARPRARSAGPAIVAHLRRRPADLVIGSHTHLNVLLALLRPVLPPSTRLVLREPTLHPAPSPQRPADRLLGRALGRADLVVATSEAMHEHLVGTVRGPARVALIPNPVDVAALRAGAERVLADNAEGLRGAIADAPHLVCVGRLAAGKAHDDLLRALAAVASGTLLTIVGDGPLRDELESLSRTLGIVDQVRFTGRIDDPDQLAARVAAADALVHPSRFEGMPNAVLEALALGTPVIATEDLSVLDALAEEVGPSVLQLVPRTELPEAIAAVRSAGAARVLRPSLLPDRFRVDQVVAALVEAVAHGGARPDA